MRIAVVSDWYSEGVGYAENFLPAAFARLGHEVHLLTSDLQIYGTAANYDQVYRQRLGERRVGTGTTRADGFALHRLGGSAGRLGVEIARLEDELALLGPDIVYCFEIACPTTAAAARARSRAGFKLFCESRLHSSIRRTAFGLPAESLWKLKGRMLGVRRVIDAVEKFYPVAPDVLDNIVRCFGVPEERCELSSLAVATDLFAPSRNPQERSALRARLGLNESDLVCIYTGRLTPDKGPLLLARAVDVLQQRGAGHVRGLFVGEGEVDYVSAIAASRGCVVHRFVPVHELAGFYRSADIGVWPLQESTSQLDAMACGLPLVVNDTVEDRSRLGDVGRTFRKDDVDQLAAVLLELDNQSLRADIGARAAQRVARDFSWGTIASRRAADFARALDAA